MSDSIIATLFSPDDFLYTQTHTQCTRSDLLCACACVKPFGSKLRSAVGKCIDVNVRIIYTNTTWQINVITG